MIDDELAEMQKDCRPKLLPHQLALVKLAMANYALHAAFDPEVMKEAEEICFNHDD